MSHELHYTSVPRGLKPGNVGFCTVATTAKLQPHLAERMEGLSGYRMVFPPGSPSASLNPVVVSHLKFSLGSQTYSIFSRVAFSGLDYSQRGNNYAHHVAIELCERPEGGPAWLASQRGFLDPAWTGEPRILASGRKPPKGDPPLKPCQAWAERFGDAGWAGALAQAFIDDPRKPAYLVFEPGQEVLPLFAEALALLPVTKRWDVSFSTYYTGQGQGLTCLWRAVLRDSPEHEQARRLADALILDPAVTNGSAKASKLVDAARSGQVLEAPKVSPTAARRATPPTVLDTEKAIEPEDQSEWWFPRGKPETYEVVAPQPPARVDIPAPPRAMPAPQPLPRGAKPSGRRAMSAAERRAQLLLKVWIGSVACLVVALLCFTIYLLGPTSPPKQVAQARPTAPETPTPEKTEMIPPKPEKPKLDPEKLKPDPEKPKPDADRPKHIPDRPIPGGVAPPLPAPSNPPKAPTKVLAPLEYAGPFTLKDGDGNESPLKYDSPFLYGNNKGAEVRLLKWTPRAGALVKSIKILIPESKHLRSLLTIEEDVASGTIKVQSDGNGSGTLSPVGIFEIHDAEVWFKGNPESAAGALKSLEQSVLMVVLENERLAYRFGDEPKPLAAISLKGSSLTTSDGIVTPIFPKPTGKPLESPFAYQVESCRLQDLQSHKEMSGFQYAKAAEPLGGIRVRRATGELSFLIYVQGDDLHIQIEPPPQVPLVTWLNSLKAHKTVKSAEKELAKPPQQPAEPPLTTSVTSATDGKITGAVRLETPEDRVKALTYLIDALTIKEQCEVAFDLRVTFGEQNFLLRLRDPK